MICFNINRILLSLYISAALCGCRCKDEGITPPVSKKVVRHWEEYWPSSSNKKWVFQVSKLEGLSIIPLEDDTLEFYQDTNILNQNALYFKEYKFRKFPDKQKWIVGNYLLDSSVLRLSLYDIYYILYDLNNIKDSGAYVKFTCTGKPIDDRYTLSYSTPITKNYPTGLGKVSVIGSLIEFAEPYGTKGYILTNTKIFFGKGMGIVQLSYQYERQNVPSQRDTFFRLQYDIKKIIN